MAKNGNRSHCEVVSRKFLIMHTEINFFKDASRGAFENSWWDTWRRCFDCILPGLWTPLNVEPGPSFDGFKSYCKRLEKMANLLFFLSDWTRINRLLLFKLNITKCLFFIFFILLCCKFGKGVHRLKTEKRDAGVLSAFAIVGALSQKNLDVNRFSCLWIKREGRYKNHFSKANLKGHFELTKRERSFLNKTYFLRCSFQVANFFFARISVLTASGFSRRWSKNPLQSCLTSLSNLSPNMKWRKMPKYMEKKAENLTQATPKVRRKGPFKREAFPVNNLIKFGGQNVTFWILFSDQTFMGADVFLDFHFWTAAILYNDHSSQTKKLWKWQWFEVKEKRTQQKSHMRQENLVSYSKIASRKKTFFVNKG